MNTEQCFDCLKEINLDTEMMYILREADACEDLDVWYVCRSCLSNHLPNSTEETH